MVFFIWGGGGVLKGHTCEPKSIGKQKIVNIKNEYIKFDIAQRRVHNIDLILNGICRYSNVMQGM